MDISKLDEYQGLEAQMVRDWLTARKAYRLDGFWRHPQEQKYCYTDGEYGGLLWSDTLHKLTVDFGLASVQALLREINPRMRKGWPSDEALSAHPFWLLNNAPIHCLPSVVTSSFVREKKRRSDPEFADIAPHYAWPCDEHGNKVRWPTDSEGKML